MRRGLFVVAFLCATPLAAALHLWTGAASDRVSDPANWTHGSPAADPLADVELPAGVARKAIVNDVGGLALRGLAFSGGGYTISGQPLHVRALIADTSGGPAENVIGSDLVLDADVAINSATTTGNGLTLSGAISGPGGMTLQSRGIVTLAGAAPNSYAGATRITAGTLRLAGSASAKAIPGALAAGAGGTLDLGGRTAVLGPLAIAGGAKFTNGRIVLAADVVITGTGDSIVSLSEVVLTETRRITIAGPAGGVSLEGVSGPPGAGLVITGGTATTIDGDYSGPTTLNAATAVIRNAATAVTLGAGARLSGSTGTVISHGGTVGDLFVGGALQLDRASTVTSTPDGVVRATGPIDLGDASLVLLARRTYQKQRTLIENLGTAPIRGTFRGLAEGALTSDLQYRVTYRGGSGGDVVAAFLGRVAAPIAALRYSSAPLSAGDSATITVNLYPVDGAPPPGGSIVLRARDAVVGRANVSSSGLIYIDTAPLPGGTYPIAAEYSGDDVYAPVSATTLPLFVSNPPPKIDSIIGAMVPGEPSELVFKGSNFIAPVTVTMEPESARYRARFVSATEVRVTVIAETSIVIGDGTSLPVSVANGSSNKTVRVWVPARNGLPRIATTFAEKSVTAKVAPGAITYWLETDDAVTHDNVIQAGGDGLARWDFGAVIPYSARWAIVDSDGHATVAGLSFPRPSVYDEAGLLQIGPNGKPSRLELDVLPGRNAVYVLWVRPGTGAWRLDVSSGSPANHGRYRFELFASDARPLGSSPPTPDAFAPGDVVIALTRDYSDRFAMVRVTAQIPDAELKIQALSDPSSSLIEGSPVTINVWRFGNSQNTMTIAYNAYPSNSTTDVIATRGTLTFAPGEMMKSFVVETIDDHVYGGGLFYYDLESEGEMLTQPLQGVRLVDKTSSPLTFVIDDARVIEGDSGTRQVLLNVTVSKPVLLSIPWQRDDGKANGTVVVTPPETRRTIAVTFDANTTPEPDRTIGVTLTPSSLPGKRHGVVTIVDDDVPRLRIDDVRTTESAATATFTAALSRAASQPVTVRYATADVSAHAGSDYSAIFGTLTFAPGEMTKTIAVPILGRGIFAVTLSDASVAFSKAAGIANVAGNAPPPPALAIDDAAGIEGTTIRVAVRLAAPAAEPVSVRFKTYDGTATSPNDYVSAAGALTFLPGEVEKTIAIETAGNAAVDVARTFFVILSEATVPIERSAAVCTIVESEPPPRRRPARR